MSHIWMRHSYTNDRTWHDTFMYDMTHMSCCAYECGRTRTYEWVMSCGVTLYMRNMHMTWLDVPHSCTTWLMCHVAHMNAALTWHESFFYDMTHVSCRTYECGIHIRMTWLDMPHSYTTWLICDVTNMIDSCHTYDRSYVYFAEYSLFYRALLQKRPIILRSLLIVLRAQRAHRLLASYQDASTMRNRE